MKTYSFSFALLLLSGSLAVAQEKKVKFEPIPVIKLDRKDLVIYEKDIHPIFENKCIVCHAGKNTEGKLDLSSHEKLMKGGAARQPHRCREVRREPYCETFGPDTRSLHAAGQEG